MLKLNWGAAKKPLGAQGKKITNLVTIINSVELQKAPGRPGQKMINFKTKTNIGELHKTPWAPRAGNWLILVLELILASCQKAPRRRRPEDGQF